MSTEKKTWKLTRGILQTSPNVPFPFANFALCPFSVTNYSQDYDYTPSPVNPPRKIIKSGGGLGHPLPYLYVFFNKTLGIQINNIKLPPKNRNLKLDMSKSTKSEVITFPIAPIFLLLFYLFQ